MNFARGIGDLPDGHHYKVFREGAYEAFLSACAKLFRREIDVGGVFDPAADDSCHVLVCGYDWLDVVQTLLSQGVADERIVIVLPSQSASHASKLFASLLSAKLRWRDGAVELDWSDLHDAMCSLGYGGIGRLGRRMMDASKYYCSLGLEPDDERLRFIAERIPATDQRTRFLDLLHASPARHLALFAEVCLGSIPAFDHVRIQPGDTVINVGIGAGEEVPYFTMLVGPQGIVHNVDPQGYDSLTPEARLSVTLPNIQLHRLALGETSGMVSMVMAGVGGEVGGSNGDCPMLPLDEFVAREGIGRVDVIKLDDQGFDLNIIKGALATIRRHRPQLVVSVYWPKNGIVDTVQYLLERLEGYEVFLEIGSIASFGTRVTFLPREIVASRPSPWGVRGQVGPGINLRVRRDARYWAAVAEYRLRSQLGFLHRH